MHAHMHTSIFRLLARSMLVRLTELAWVYAIDVTLLAEPTNLYASLGTALVFCSALAVLHVSSSNGGGGGGGGGTSSKEDGAIVKAELCEGLLPRVGVTSA